MGTFPVRPSNHFGKRIATRPFRENTVQDSADVHFSTTAVGGLSILCGMQSSLVQQYHGPHRDRHHLQEEFECI